jgi:pyruvate kinase
MSRHTKIVATLGPASSTAEVLERMVQAGVDVVRMNFSHGTVEDHIARAAAIRARQIRPHRSAFWAICRGQKSASASSRTARSPWSSARTSSSTPKCALGNQERVGLDYKDLPKDVVNGDILLLDDGRLKLEVLTRAWPRNPHPRARWAASCPTTRASTARAAA